jgi:CheY-like chemotaxis protein
VLPSLRKESTDSLPSEPQKSFKVLLVEDNEINLKLLAMTMAKLSHSYTTATNGQEAVSAFKSVSHSMSSSSSSRAFDIVFMDIQMPVQDGLSATRDIRRFERENGKTGMEGCAIVALTGAASVSARQEAFASGIDLFLTKPVSMKRVAEIMDELKRDGRDGLGRS